MTTPVVSRHPAITGALTHALGDLDAVRAGKVGASDSFGAWGNGRSSRFVTATARTGTIPYVLDFATGP